MARQMIPAHLTHDRTLFLIYFLLAGAPPDSRAGSRLEEARRDAERWKPATKSEGREEVQSVKLETELNEAGPRQTSAAG